MPKLNKKQTEVVGGAEAQHGSQGSFDLIPAGKYVAKLTAVTDEDNNFGEPQWIAEFSDITSVKTGQRYPGRQWYRMPLPGNPKKVPDDYDPPQKGRNKGKTREEAWADLQVFRAGVLKAFFESLGYTEDTDTDEIVEDEATAIIQIGIQTAQSGARKGERFNRIFGIESADGVEISESDGDEDDDEF